MHVADRNLLAMCWNNQIYFDTCLPFGLRSAPKLFNVLVDLLSWILIQHGISLLIHYLDDFLMMGPADSIICHENFSTIQRFCQELGIPLASDKLEGPSHPLNFLGIELDTVCMETRLPGDKLTRNHTLLSSQLTRKKATKRDILSLVGLFQHASNYNVVHLGRTFMARMYSITAIVKELHYFTRLNKEFVQICIGGTHS